MYVVFRNDAIIDSYCNGRSGAARQADRMRVPHVICSGWRKVSSKQRSGMLRAQYTLS